MNLKENIEKNTDTAWKTLHDRLENDGLLTANRPGGFGKNLLPQITRWAVAASIVTVAICAATLFYIESKYQPTPGKVVLTNQAGAPTLVTTLQDGSIIYLSDQATIEYPQTFAGNKREVSLRGNAYFEISSNRERPFVIDTQEATIEVLGTAFNIQNSGGKDFSLAVRHGEVKVTSKLNGESVNVKDNYTVFLENGKLNTQRVMDYGALQDYIKRIHFKDQKLGDIIRILNEYNFDALRYDVKPDFADRKLTVTFDGNTPDEIALLINKALNLDPAQKQNAIYITQPKP